MPGLSPATLQASPPLPLPVGPQTSMTLTFRAEQPWGSLASSSQESGARLDAEECVDNPPALLAS